MRGATHAGPIWPEFGLPKLLLCMMHIVRDANGMTPDWHALPSEVPLMCIVLSSSIPEQHLAVSRCTQHISQTRPTSQATNRLAAPCAWQQTDCLSSSRFAALPRHVSFSPSLCIPICCHTCHMAWQKSHLLVKE